MTARAAGPATRGRLVAGLAHSISRRGYRDTTVSDIVAAARTSRRTFYEVFATKDDCFVALVLEMTDRMRSEIAAAVDPAQPWQEQVEAGVTAWLAALASRPEVSLSWIREAPFMGSAALVVQRATMESLTEMLIALTGTPAMARAGIEPVSPQTATVLLGGLRELVATAVETGQDITSITGTAVDAALALLGPRSSLPAP